jgi:hypothetical protein
LASWSRHKAKKKKIGLGKNHSKTPKNQDQDRILKNRLFPKKPTFFKKEGFLV